MLLVELLSEVTAPRNLGQMASSPWLGEVADQPTLLWNSCSTQQFGNTPCISNLNCTYKEIDHQFRTRSSRDIHRHVNAFKAKTQLSEYFHRQSSQLIDLIWRGYNGLEGGIRMCEDLVPVGLNCLYSKKVRVQSAL